MKKYVYPVFIGILLAGAVLTLHDMQVSEGMGLYLAMQFGADDRRAFDILADIGALLIWMILLWIPVRRLQNKSGERLFGILVSYIAFMPGISTAYILHLFVDFKLPSFAAEGLWLSNAETVISYAGLLVPFVILVGGTYCAAEHQKLTKVQKSLIVIAAVFLVFSVLFSEWTLALCFAAMYLIWLLAVDFWHKAPIINWPIYLFLFCKCIYNFYDIMAKYNL